MFYLVQHKLPGPGAMISMPVYPRLGLHNFLTNPNFYLRSDGILIVL